jgi:hypothetical protein
MEELARKRYGAIIFGILPFNPVKGVNIIVFLFIVFPG